MSEAAKTPTGERRLVELDALRGLAALAVVLFHMTTRYEIDFGHTSAPLFSVPWGPFGVQLFFALSGFVIFMTLERTTRPMDFIVSRASRLYPAYWAAILLTTAVVWAGGMTALQVPAGVVAANFTMVQKFALLPDVDGVYWTLAVELSFYIVMFALWSLGLLRRIEWVLVGWIGLKWLWWLVPDLSWRLGLLLIQNYIPFFAIGICAYRIYARQRRLVEVAPIIAFALVTTCVLDGPAYLAVGLLATAVFLGFANGRLGWLGARPLAWLGGVSYTLYLLHENIGFTIINRLEGAGLNANLAILAAIAVSLLLAWGVTTLVEQPAMRLIRTAWKTRTGRTPPASPARSLP